MKFWQAFKFCPRCAGQLKSRVPGSRSCHWLVCQKCHNTLYLNPHPTVLAIIEDKTKTKILLVKRAVNPYKNMWDVPGGFVEVGQNLETAIKQEIKEELGAEVKSLTYFDSFVSVYPHQGVDEDVVGVAFRVQVKNQSFKPADDISEAKWFDKNNLPKTAPLADVQQAIGKLVTSDKCV